MYILAERADSLLSKKLFFYQNPLRFHSGIFKKVRHMSFGALPTPSSRPSRAGWPLPPGCRGRRGGQSPKDICLHRGSVHLNWCATIRRSPNSGRTPPPPGGSGRSTQGPGHPPPGGGVAPRPSAGAAATPERVKVVSHLFPPVFPATHAPQIGPQPRKICFASFPRWLGTLARAPRCRRGSRACPANHPYQISRQKISAHAALTPR